MATRTKITPSFGAYGFYKLLAPFVVEDAVSYRCDAVRSFRDVTESGLDVYKEFYEPKSISINDYEDDLTLNPNIITLISDTGMILYVPDTYVLSIPKIDVAPYNHFVFSIDVGMFSAFHDFTSFKNELQSYVDLYLGLDSAKIEEHIVPIKQNLTLAQAKQLEASRLNVRNRDKSTYAQLKDAESEINRLRQTVDELSVRLAEKENP